MRKTRWVTLGASSLFAACGGTAVIDGVRADGGSGGSSTGSTTTTSSSTTSSTSSSTTSSTTNSPPCSDHEDCPGGLLCLFGTGQCVPGCDGFCDPCGPEAVCNGCATSSCPMCADCVAACVPIAAGQCDDDDPCGDAEVCLFDRSQCVPSCDSDACADPNTYCDPCATGSCCGCYDCVSACLPV